MTAAAVQPAVYRSRAITQARRTKADMSEIRDAILEELDARHPMTVRQLFYRLVSRGAIRKTESEYKHTIIRLVVEMRRAGELPYDWIADNTRWMRKPTTFGSAEDALRTTAQAYRRALWSNQLAYVEIWLEKDALAGVIYEITKAYDVPLMVTRGYPSLTFLYEAAEAIRDTVRPAFLYYLGDFDPSGLDIPRHTAAQLRELAQGHPIEFQTIAVTSEQIEAWHLPTRPTKTSDSRSGRFTGEASVEVDAIPVEDLVALVEEAITDHLDPAALDRTLRIEAEERASLIAVAERWGRTEGQRGQDR